ncbi:MAG: AraC family transcriptional regulator, partial [Bacteroidota bacterium]
MKEIIRIKSIRQVHDFFALARPHHPLVSVIPIDDRITNFNFGAATYVFEFYQINLKVGFSGSLTYGRNAYDFEEGTLTFIRPEQ